MESKPRFYVYERKELMILAVLGTLVAVFFFTLGLHLGKQTAGVQGNAHSHSVGEVKPVQDQPPPSEELSEQTPKVAGALDDFAVEALKSEIAETGIVLNQKIQVDLPVQKKSPVTQSVLPSAPTAKVDAKFLIQIGSYPNESEANKLAAPLSATGLKTIVQPVDLGNKGKRYRVFVGGYLTSDEAKTEGSRLKAEGRISAFIVVPIKH